MLFGLLALSLLSAPFHFELEQGIALEPTVGATFTDKVDPIGATTGGRITYIHPNSSDAFVTIEASGEVHWNPQAEGIEAKRRYVYEGSLLFYEVFNPWVARIALGAGAERRLSRWASTFCYRAGVGYFYQSRLGAYFDVGGRLIDRAESRGGSSSQINPTLSFQWVF